VLRAEVVGVTERADPLDGAARRWVYLDAGVFSGLVETMDEAIRYRIDAVPTRTDLLGPRGPVVLAGPTCDSADVLYRWAGPQLPLSLRAGDLVDIHAAGAYTVTYATVGFNGFDPPAVHVLAAREG
jgi:ornithine decarboxylase